MNIHLTKRQHDLLLSDVADLNPTDDRAFLAAELRIGRDVTVSTVLLEEVREFADHDQVPSEQIVYRRLLRKLHGVSSG